jgi:hypothetical protein
MKTGFTLRVMTAAIVLSLPADEVTAMDPGPTAAALDWPAFLGQHDMLFDKLPRGWTEAPHFGNAMVGSMLHQAADTLRLQIFRADVQDHRDDTWGWTAYSRPRLQLGHFSLHPVGKLTGCHWRKDLWNAELTGTLTTDRGEIRIRHFTHAMDMAIVTELTPTAGEQGCHWTWHPAPARTTRGGYPTQESEIAGFARQYGSHYTGALKVYQANPAGRLEQAGPTSVWIQNLLAGGQYATAWSEQVRGDTRTHIVSIANIIQDMLLQSWGDPAKEEPGPIRVFPAVPTAWKDVEFHDLRAEGAFLVSAKRSGGRTQWVRIKSLAGEPCRVRPGMTGEIRIQGARPYKLGPVSLGIYEIDVKKGEEVRLHAVTEP